MQVSFGRLVTVFAVTAALSGCGSTVAGSQILLGDGGVPDAGLIDAGVPDAGVPDAGLTTPPDAGFAGVTCPNGLLLCGDGFTCVLDASLCPLALNCPSGQTFCASTPSSLAFCSGLTNDPNNCGSCRRVCGFGQLCVNATCQVR
jgi:hypothetical protein